MNVTKNITDIGTVSFPRKFGDKKFRLTNEQLIFSINNIKIVNNAAYITTDDNGISNNINYSIWVENIIKKPSLSKYII